ncbi:type I restriction endonuclease subunit R [Actinomadura logoneensis]|uniref:Type I restriction enzyme endonuclease subunit n=1 Tax=Actinomadura logoneensis TaxID=2293572 RepID=A0A372JMZ9_9ACTN|nr:HsdR family type I site-specific deoxyribonuclease [Actinomadura logoneensis]RFU41387.1 type I restriction endonuclease subunit R [Actinomadura logoneensis]
MTGPEYTEVEAPLIEQLVGMGWEHVPRASAGSFDPRGGQAPIRESFTDVLLRERLRAALLKINLGPDGAPWLDDARIDQAVAALERLGAPSLLEANEKATALLIDGVQVPGPDGGNGRARTVHFIDWTNWERNDFTVVSQFRVDVPGTQGRKHIVPDVVLFVNGVPLVVAEAKSPARRDGMLEAATQIRRYTGERDRKAREGNPKLFHTVQLTVATNGDKALLGTFTSKPEHYVPWKDAYPLSDIELAADLDIAPERVRAQERLAGVVLKPERLLTIVHDYVTFMTLDNGHRVKIAPRYQQFRAVERTIDRLLTGETRIQNGEQDKRGGVVWHTQGSGKSLTMTFLVRRMRSIEDLANYKVVLVTDRKDLQKQLHDTMALTGEHLKVAKRVKDAKTELALHSPDIVFVMIQKQQDVAARQAAEELGERTPSLGELNTDESIVVLIDEAHRSHGSMLHLNLLEALPNAARIGFTGTPIIMGKKKRTEEIFGTFIDRYRLAEAEADGAVVPIFYEGHTVKGAVRDGRDLDEVFEDMFAEHTEQERAELQRRYATRGDVLEAQELIDAKARHMLRHYVTTVMPAGFKAQVVAHSREATVRYREALTKARDELVADALNPGKLPEHLREADPYDPSLRPRVAVLVHAYRKLDLLRALDFVPVISAAANDPERLWEWSEPQAQDSRIEAFKKPFPAELGPRDKPIGFLIVNAMLLTGFDAPIEQVMYVDRSLKEDTLLQAVARVNRTAEGKTCGYVVDYYGVANHLAKALKAYASEDVEGALNKLEDEVPQLEALSRRVRSVFERRGVQPSAATIEECVLLLEEGVVFDRYEAELKRFLTTVNRVMPNPAVRPFLGDARLFAEIATRARRRYRVDGGEFDASLYGAKVRELIDEHMTSLGIDEKLPPVALTAADFDEKVAALPGARSRASEMEHAARHHIEVNYGRDPRLYKRLSERLEEILQQYADDWDRQAAELAGLIVELRDAEEAGAQDPRSRVESALYGVLVGVIFDDALTYSENDAALMAGVSDLLDLVLEDVRQRDFWRNPVREENLGKKVARRLLSADIGVDISQAVAVAADLMDVLRHNRDVLTDL